MKTMKHLFGALPLAALALSFTACGNDETFGEPETTPAGNQVTMTFTANAPAPAAGTRTLLVEGTQVYWTPNDVIGVYSCIPNTEYGTFETEEPGNPFTTSLSAAAPTASFTGEATEGALQYIAVYPQDKFAHCEWISGSTMLGFILPPVQQAVARGFATGLNPSLAMTDDMGGDLTFENLCALVKFSISGGDAGELKSVTLTDLGGTGLSGIAQYVYAPSMEMEFVMAAVPSVPSVTLTGSFTTGTDYYFVVAPSVNTDSGQPAALKNGFSLTFTRRDGTSFTKTASSGIGDTNLASGMILDLGAINLSGATYREAITNLAFINAVGNKVKWEVTGGIVYLTEANKEAIEEVTSLNIEDKNLTDISGIEYFTNLTSLDCSDNQLTALPVENLTNLTSLRCGNNQLTALPVENLTNLTELYCSYNQLTDLPVEKLTNLTELSCSYNQLKELPVESLTNLTSLYCDNNQLTALPVGNLTQLKNLYCNNNQLIALLVGNLTLLEQLNCGTNLLTEQLPVENLTNLTSLYCNNNQLISLPVGNLTQLKNLSCSNNQLTSLSVGSLTNLVVLDCSENRLTELDITSVTNLNGLYCGNQTDAAGESQTLTLILTSTQKAEKWDKTWKKWGYNARVTAEVKDLGSTAHW